MFELFLSKTPNKKPAPPLLDKLATPQKNTLCSFHFARARFFFLLMKRVFFCGVLPSKYSGRWRGCPQFDFAKEKRNSPQNPPSAFPLLKRNGNGKHERAKIPSPQPPSFLPACLGFAPKTFRRTDFEAVPISLARHLF